MSMSEFEKHLYDSQDNHSYSHLEKWELPDDFTEEDIAFAQELGDLFLPEKEEIPPYFVQTLLEPEDTRFQTIEPGFEQKTYAQVFRRLNLHRRLFRSRRSRLHSVVNTLPTPPRRFTVLVATFLLLMLATMMMTSTSFASGIVFLLSGAHSGVVQMKSYPSGLASSRPPTPHQEPRKQSQVPATPKQISLLDAQQQLHFPMHWPLFTPSNYSLNGIYLYQPQNQTWADGPFLELDFDYALPGVSPHGSGKIAICEFKPQGKVFQVVQLGAAHEMEIDQNGRAQAIFVNGQWEQINQSSYDWVYGERSELIYEYDGVIFWIVGDQRDGIDKDVLLNIATSLTTLNLEESRHLGRYLDSVTLPPDDSTWSFASDVVYLDSPDGPSLRIAGASSTVPNPDGPPPKAGT